MENLGLHKHLDEMRRASATVRFHNILQEMKLVLYKNKLENLLEELNSSTPDNPRKEFFLPDT